MVGWGGGGGGGGGAKSVRWGKWYTIINDE